MASNSSDIYELTSSDHGRFRKVSSISSASHSNYDTISTASSDDTSDYCVYDTFSSTTTGHTYLGGSQVELHLSANRLENRPKDDRGPGGGKGKFNLGNLGHSDNHSADLALGWLRTRRGKCEKVQKHLKKKLPIISWLPHYNTSCAISDLIAGVTVGLTAIPQSIAYAIVAGLPPQYGLYSAFMGCFVYTFFGSAKDITIGPTAIMALMTKTYATYGPEYAVLLAFLSGFLILIFGLLQLGFLIDFISVPVIAGFTSAAALTIASGQIKGLLGVTIDPHHKSHTHAGVVDYYIDVANNIHTIRYQDAVLGLVCSVILLSLRALNRTNWLKPISSNPPNTTPGCIQKLTNRLPLKLLAVVDKIIWFICTARNAIVVVACLVMAALVDPELHDCKTHPDDCVFTLTGSIQSGLPAFQPPPFSLGSYEVSNSSYDLFNNDTELTMTTLLPDIHLPNITDDSHFHHGHESMDADPLDGYVGFFDMVGKLGSAIIIIPIIAILESVAIAKAFANGKPVDASQEMVALGLCNIAGSFVQAMPTTGSFSRTAVNCASGVKTAFGGVYTGALVILCLAFLMPYCAFIPKATLSAVIMTAVIFSVEHRVLRPMWSSKKVDMFPGLVCFIVGLFYELEMGIFSGMGVHIAILLYHTARPGVSIVVKSTPGLEYLAVTPANSIVFPSVSYVRSMVSKAGIKQGSSKLPVVIDCCHVGQADFTAAEGFKAMINDFKARGQDIYWINVCKGVLKTLRAINGKNLKIIKSTDDLLKNRIEAGLKRRSST